MVVKSITYFLFFDELKEIYRNGFFIQGDPLESIGRIKLSWLGTHYGEVYTNAVMNEIGLNEEQRKLVTMYALLNQISCTCENGIQYNQNTKSIVDREKEYRDKKIIKVLASELQLL